MTLIFSLAKKKKEKIFHAKKFLLLSTFRIYIALPAHKTFWISAVSPLNLLLRQQEGSSHTFCLRPPVHCFTNSELSG